MDEIPEDVMKEARELAEIFEHQFETGYVLEQVARDIAAVTMREREKWQGKHPVPGAVTVTLEPRPDGGLRVWSASDPGLILSGRNADEVLADILPAAEALRELKSEPTL